MPCRPGCRRPDRRRSAPWRARRAACRRVEGRDDVVRVEGGRIGRRGELGFEGRHVEGRLVAGADHDLHDGAGVGGEAGQRAVAAFPGAGDVVEGAAVTVAAGVAQVGGAGMVVVVEDAGGPGGRGVVVDDQGLTGVVGEVDDDVGALGRHDGQRGVLDDADPEGGRIGDVGDRLRITDRRCRGGSRRRCRSG